MSILGIYKSRGVLPVTQTHATVIVRVFDGTSAFDIELRDGVFTFPDGEQLESDDIEKLKTFFADYEMEGEEEYLLTKAALGL